MEFFTFLGRESTEFNKYLLVAGVFAGIVNTLLIFILTAAAGKIAAGNTAYTELAMVCICLVTYWSSKGWLMRRTTYVVEEVIKNVRLRLATKIRNTDLASFEELDTSSIYNAISSHTIKISRAAPAVVSAGTSLVLLTCAFLIIFLLSKAAFLILVGTLGFVLMVLLTNRAKILTALTNVTAQDNRFVKRFGDLLDGFKELKMSTDKNQDFFENYLEPSAEDSRELRVQGGLIIDNSVILASSGLFILLAAVVFLVPVFSPADAPKVVRLSTLIVFIMGPLSEVVAVFSLFTEATASVNEINRIENKLDTVFEKDTAGSTESENTQISLRNIRLEDITFSYRDENGEPSFSLEPSNFHLSHPEVVFITGGNGSGKSTFFKVLAGLYPPATGGILFNDSVVGIHNRNDYRNLFAPIFADFHLFDHVFGVKALDLDKLQSLLYSTDLDKKTSVIDRDITTIHLSTGQRKRLALVLALMEDKPVLLLDEWAAEQDPGFRQKFYGEIIPELKRQGKSVIAITHDDDHYDVADRVVKMQYGKFIPFEPNDVT